jgi:hypothetical protein
MTHELRTIVLHFLIMIVARVIVKVKHRVSPVIIWGAGVKLGLER